MKTITKIGVFTGLAALLLLGISKLKSLANAWSNLLISPKIDGGIDNFKLTLTTLTIPVAIDFSNRSAENVVVELRVCDVYYNGNLLGASQPITNQINITPNSVTTLRGIRIDLSNTTLLKFFSSIMTGILAIFSQSGFNISNIAASINVIVSQLSLKVSVIVNNSVEINNVKVKFGETAEAKDYAKGTPNGTAGLGLIARGSRTIRPLSEYEKHLLPRTELAYSDPIIIENVSVDETVREMKKSQKNTKAIPQNLLSTYKKIMLYFYCVDSSPSARNDNINF